MSEPLVESSHSKKNQKAAVDQKLTQKNDHHEAEITSNQETKGDHQLLDMTCSTIEISDFCYDDFLCESPSSACGGHSADLETLALDDHSSLDLDDVDLLIDKFSRQSSLKANAEKSNKKGKRKRSTNIKRDL